MAPPENAETSNPLVTPSFPTGRVKKIVKFDKDITRISSEALFLVSGAAELFLQFLAGKSSQVAVEKKRKIVNTDHLRVAVKRHQPTCDFLLDSLPVAPDHPPATNRMVKEKAVLARNTRSIDSFFRKPQKEGGVNCADDCDNLKANEVDEC